MNIAVVIAALVAAFMFGLFLALLFFRALRYDPISVYGLFRVRDKLIRLVVEQKISRDNAYFSAVYANVNAMISSCHILSGPEGWEIAKKQGQLLARQDTRNNLRHMPEGHNPPDPMIPVLTELCSSLQHIVDNHFGIFTLIDSHKREHKKVQREQAKRLLRDLQSCSNELRASLV